MLEFLAIENPYALSSAIIIGLLASIHCSAMCSPIAGLYYQWIPPSKERQTSGTLYKSAFFAGKIITYCLFGIAATLALSPLSISDTTALLLPRILMGTTLLALAFYFAAGSRQFLWAEKIGQHIWKWAEPLNKKLFPVDKLAKALALGAIWGLLPCGLLYSVALIAGASGNALYAVIYMAVFGLTVSVPVAGFAQLGQALQRGYWRYGLIAWLLLAGVLVLASPFIAPELVPNAASAFLRFCLP